MAGPLGTPLGLAQRKRASPRCEWRDSLASHRLEGGSGTHVEGQCHRTQKGPTAGRGSLRTMHGGGSAPSCCAFTHRVAFDPNSGYPLPVSLLWPGPALMTRIEAPVSTVQGRSAWGGRSRTTGQMGRSFPEPGGGGGLQLHFGAEGQAGSAIAGEAASTEQAGFDPSTLTLLRDTALLLLFSC